MLFSLKDKNCQRERGARPAGIVTSKDDSRATLLTCDPNSVTGLEEIL